MNTIKTLILAGGFGTRLSEETVTKPKPMLEIGGKPILWHILKIYSFYGFNDFLIALGYKGDQIKKFFLEYIDYSGDISISIKKKEKKVIREDFENWNLNLVDTGIETATGGRVKKLFNYLKDHTFMCTYGDGVANVNIKKLLKFHREKKKLATITAVRPPARFGGLEFGKDGLVEKFVEKPLVGESWINGGFMVFEPEILSIIKQNDSSLEYELLEYLSSEKQLSAFIHDGFWQCMDTKRDKDYLEKEWTSGFAPWKLW
tara:strand:- start:5709 stop:6488 length:780 start_codon:yes stop_codon:yes gene_type:complete